MADVVLRRERTLRRRPVFGDLAVFDRLMADTHGHYLRPLIDWVPNHTSDRHPGS